MQEKLESIVNAFARELTRGKASVTSHHRSLPAADETGFICEGVHEAGAKWPSLLPPLLGAESSTACQKLSFCNASFAGTLDKQLTAFSMHIKGAIVECCPKPELPL